MIFNDLLGMSRTLNHAHSRGKEVTCKERATQVTTGFPSHSSKVTIGRVEIAFVINVFIDRDPLPMKKGRKSESPEKTPVTSLR